MKSNYANEGDHLSYSYPREKSEGHQVAWQWAGWNLPQLTNENWVRMKADIKFEGSVPPPSGNFGFKIFG